MVVHEDVRLERSLTEIWEQARELLSKRLPHPTVRTWLPGLQLLDISESEAIVGACNDVTCKNLQKHVGTISESISDVVNRTIACKLVVDSSVTVSEYTGSIASITVLPPSEQQLAESLLQLPASVTRSHISPAAALAASNLNSKYSFDSFVIGSNNRFCHSAARAVAERPGESYNPLFIYGGVGLGKTHIMQAIGHHVLINSPNLTVRYMSCERFTNEVINSIRFDKMADFRKRYRQVDLLLMDDIQFIEGKESTQEEFFHTFNALRESGRQIVLSSDRPPKALARLEERLRSRFEWGLIADIQAPDLETRMAILRTKRDLERLHVPDDVLEYIAATFTKNVRELEGALVRAAAYGNLTGEPLTIATAAGILNPGATIKQKPKATLEQIMEVVAAHYHLETSELKSSKRSQDLTLPRHIAMYLANKMLQLSFPRIGAAFGNRKHTSAIYAINKVEELIAENAEVSEAIKQITRRLND